VLRLRLLFLFFVFFFFIFIITIITLCPRVSRPGWVASGRLV